MPVSKKNKKFWEFKNTAEREAELRIYGEISKYSWWGNDVVTASDFARELGELEDIDTLNLCINSLGGVVTEAHAIYNTLMRYKAKNNVKIITHIDGAAASAASYIAMAGNEICMGIGASLMIHNVQGGASGESKDLRRAADIMDKMKENIIDIYKLQTNLSREEISELMDKTSWMTADEALGHGFIDRIEDYLDITDEEMDNLFTTEMTNIIKVLPERIRQFRNNTQKNKIINNIALEGAQGGNMAITLLQIKNEAPEILDQIRNEAIQEERNRIRELDALPVHNQAAIDMVNEAKFNNPESAEKVAFNIMTSTSFKAHQEVNAVKNAQDNSGTKEIKVAVVEGKENNTNELTDAINQWR